jgi:hypothetical protein
MATIKPPQQQQRGSPENNHAGRDAERRARQVADDHPGESGAASQPSALHLGRHTFHPLQRRVGAINDADGGQPPGELLTAANRTENVEDAGVDRLAQRRLAVAEDLY